MKGTIMLLVGPKTYQPVQLVEELTIPVGTSLLEIIGASSLIPSSELIQRETE